MPDIAAQTPVSDQKRGIILVVEDDSFLRTLLSGKLRHEGFELFEATDGRQALDFLKSNRPILILLDLMMPGVDGFQVLESVRRDTRTKDIPVIVLSNVGEKQMIERVQQLGADDYLIKAHFVLDEIIERITKVLKKRYM
ncbi:MAG: response regulator [Candidatus Sungbacteria bacterium]|nr:response regulator [Candidatus Sungbacteria bacterium]